MQTETVGDASLFQFTQENHLLVHFLDGDMIILHTGIDAFQVIEFMVMGSEKRLGPVPVLMDILYYRPGDGHAVISRSPPAYLVQKDQGTG